MSADDLGDLIRRWRQATQPEEIFGHQMSTDHRSLRVVYRALASRVHPDRHPYSRREAHEAFKLLQRWHIEAQKKVADGTYGLIPILVIRRSTQQYSCFSPPRRGRLSNIYECRANSGKVLLKIAQKPQSNSLLEGEAQRLTKLRQALQGHPLRAHFPGLIDSFVLEDNQKVQHRVNVLEYEQDAVTMEDIARAYPQGIHPADMIWMFNRVLAALAVCHSQGIVHGAALPRHILLRPSDHNGILLDYCYSVPFREVVPPVCHTDHSFYPPEILASQPAGPWSDIYLAAASIVQVLGGVPSTGELPATVPRAIQSLLRACLIPAPTRRPRDAWQVMDDTREIAQKLYGPPSFRQFAMPAHE